MKLLKISIWFIFLIVLLDLSFGMISNSSTMENVVGFFLLVAIVLVSYKTSCFTTINFKRKHEK